MLLYKNPKKREKIIYRRFRKKMKRNKNGLREIAIALTMTITAFVLLFAVVYVTSIIFDAKVAARQFVQMEDTIFGSFMKLIA